MSDTETIPPTENIGEILNQIFSRIDQYRHTLEENTAAKLVNASSIERLATDLKSIMGLYDAGNKMIAADVKRAEEERLWQRGQALRSYRVDVVVSATCSATFALVLMAVLLVLHVVPDWAVWVTMGLICTMVFAAILHLRTVLAVA